MPNDTEKSSARDGRGFILFPREWEGLHDAFPEYPPQIDNRNPLLPSLSNVLFGAIGGIAYNSVRALRGQPLKHAVLTGVGAVTVPLAVLAFAVDEMGRASAKADVKAILKADNITLPRRQLFKTVPCETFDKWATLGGLFALSGVMIYRRAPNIPRFGVLAWFGAFTTGQAVGREMALKINAHEAETLDRLQKFEKDMEKGSAIYVNRTGKPPNPYLYGFLDKAVSFTKPSDSKHAQWSSFPAFGGASAALGMPLPEGHPEFVTAQQEPEGAKPHMAYVDSNGKEMVLPQRDFDWNPNDRAAGLEALQDHLDDLQSHRKASVLSAQYLWELIAKREAKNYFPYDRDQDSEVVTLEKKALELLSSIHKQHYSQIADLDWCIANTQKLILQMKSDGQWLPKQVETPADFSEAREKLLSNIRTHKKNLEVQNSTLDSTLAVAPFPDDDKDDIRKAVAENLKATTKLLDELEST